METDTISLNYRIEPVWEIVETIRNRIESRLPGFRKRIVDACIMAVSELLENAIKYGHSTQEKAGIELRFHVEKDKVAITVSNPVDSEADFTELARHIDRIRNADNLQDMFVNRMQAFLEGKNTMAKTQLGLIRIANEGGFKMDCRLEKKMLTVIATSGDTGAFQQKDVLDG